MKRNNSAVKMLKEEERRKLEEEIESIETRMLDAKEKLFQLCLKRKSSSVKIIEENETKLDYNKQLELFCNTFMKVLTNAEQSFIKILFYIGTSETYGVIFNKLESGKYKLGDCCLPYSINVEKERAESLEIDLETIFKRMKNIQYTMYIYVLHKQQIEELKNRIGERKLKIRCNHWLNMEQIQLHFYVRNEKTKRIHTFNLDLKYNFDSLRPQTISLHEIGDGEIDKNTLNKFQELFTIFRTKSLADAFDACFVNTNAITFF